VLHFKTAYERPNLFRFEYIQNQSFPPMNDRYVIWSDGKSARSWWTITPEVREAESLGLAVAGATGVSHGSAHTVSRLLMPREIGGWALTEMTGTKLLKDDKIGNEACARVRGRNVVGEPVTVWISRRTNMILKIVEVGEGLGTLSTTVYKPELNATIPEGTFIFTPPSK
jgi:outer membrane lipoprotein-sorting protein